MRTIAVLLSLLAAAPLAQADGKKKSDKPEMVKVGPIRLPSNYMANDVSEDEEAKIIFHVYPRILKVEPGKYSEIYVSFRVENYGEKFYCLGVRYEVGETHKSEQVDGGCPPFSQIVYSPGDVWSYSPPTALKFAYQGGSTVRVRVTLFNGDKDVATRTVNLLVTGVNATPAADPMAAPSIEQ